MNCLIDLPNNFRFMILENYEISENSQGWLEAEPSSQALL